MKNSDTAEFKANTLTQKKYEVSINLGETLADQLSNVALVLSNYKKEY